MTLTAPKPKAANFSRQTPRISRNFQSWGSWLIFLLLCGHLIFCHGCHGEDVDDELSVPPPAIRQHGNKEQFSQPAAPATASPSESR